MKVAGKEKLAPAFMAPVGRLELDTWKMGLPSVKPVRVVSGMFAVQVTVTVSVCPIATDPNDTGELQFRGWATGDP